MELFARNVCFGHCGGFEAWSWQISFNLVKNAFAIRQLALFATRITFYDILAQACAEIKILTFIFRLFDFLMFFLFPFSPFLFAAVIDLLLPGLACG